MNIRTFYVAPHLPKNLQALNDIAMNLWFCWNWDAVRLFIRIDARKWEESYQNPVAFLGRVSQSRFKELENDDSFVAAVDKVHNDLTEYLQRKKWFQKSHSNLEEMCIAYFSCEYGLDEGLPVYSGGLGVLSGDHLKATSDLGIPLVGVGLLYREGYFRQRLNSDGWQTEEYPENDWYNMPVKRVTDDTGTPIIISVKMGEEDVKAQIWNVKVGQTKLYLLDTNFPENSSWAREITNRLYGGDRDMRLRQELLLGIGGVRALLAIGKRPTVYHLNEGHSAFLILERIRMLMGSERMDFATARELVMASNVFTTHTPVPAGNEQFDPELLKPYLEGMVHEIGITWDDFLQFGRAHPKDTHEAFGMTVLALRLSSFCNGVSRLHGTVSRHMWKKIWEKVPEKEIPITHVTNGIHTHTWVSHDMKDLFESYFGPRFSQSPQDMSFWQRTDSIPDAELWRTHNQRRERLVFFTRKRLKQQMVRRGAPVSDVNWAEEVLDPLALTIGFARRFATYKRATLLFEDLERLQKILCNSERPVQILFSGKAHPQDIPAKELIKSIIHIIQEPPFRSRIVFIEDYDINVARYLVQGVDVWLNTPKRPLEASGTSGMKAAVNGALNLSILDGWWDEGYSPETGWAIGNGFSFESEEERNLIESRALYNCIENEVVPMFYNRDNNDLPRTWIKRMKTAIRELGSQFSTHRMLREYTEKLYIPAHEGWKRFSADGGKYAQEFAEWRKTITGAWKEIEIVNTEIQSGDVKVGDYIPVKVEVNTGNLHPRDVVVEVMSGMLDSHGEMKEEQIYPTQHQGSTENGTHLFSINIPCEESGQHGIAVRVRPHHPDMIRPFATDCVTWG